MRLTALLITRSVSLALNLPADPVNALRAHDSVDTNPAGPPALPAEVQRQPEASEIVLAQGPTENIKDLDVSVQVLKLDACNGKGDKGSPIGQVFWNDRFHMVDSLTVTGGCINFPYHINHAAWCPGVKCRFYESPNCEGMIGKDEGYFSNANMLTITPFASSGTCWWAETSKRSTDDPGESTGGVAPPHFPLYRTVGHAFWDSMHFPTGDLIVNGGCKNLDRQSNKAWWQAGYRCRFYKSKDCQDQIGGHAGLPGKDVNLIDLDNIASSATCWWDPRRAAATEEERESIGVTRRDVMVKRDQWIGYVLDGMRIPIGDLVFNGGCKNFEGQAKLAGWDKGYRCRFYTSKDCQGQIGGHAGLPGISHHDFIELGAPAWSATCWWDPRRAAATEEERENQDDRAITRTDEKRDTAIGSTFWDLIQIRTGTLVVNGGCRNLDQQSNKALWDKGYRCRFYTWKDCNGQIGGPAGLPGKDMKLIVLDNIARSATCWWDSRRAATEENGDNQDDRVITRTDEKREDKVVGHVARKRDLEQTGTLVINGGCVNFNSDSNRGRWYTNVRCRFYEDKDCKRQIGGDAGLRGHGLGGFFRYVHIDNWSRSATCWFVPEA